MKFAARNLDLIKEVNKVIALYEREGRRPTIRQVHIKLSDKKILSYMTQDYKRLTKIVCKARTAGLIGWDDIDGRRQKRDDEEDL